MNQLEIDHVNIGYIPLTDCVSIIAAKELGLFKKYGLEVTLSREVSWASVRDKIAYGVLDAAHMLASMPLACSLGVDGPKVPMATAFSLGLNGNAITVSNELYEELLNINPEMMFEQPVQANTLRQLIQLKAIKGEDKLTFGVVFPTSTHNYQLRYWLATAGIDPDNDVNMIVIPPPLMVEQMETGRIDGFCVGEPWNQYAQHKDLGKMLISSANIWNNHPEKVLGVTQKWADQNPNTHRAIIAALMEACQWLDEAQNRRLAAGMLAVENCINIPAHVIAESMTRIDADDMSKEKYSAQNVFHRYAANFPWTSHGLWFYTQMIRWGQIEQNPEHLQMIEKVYRPRTYQIVADAFDIPCPTETYKKEGIHHSNWTIQTDAGPIEMGKDLLLDQKEFDPQLTHDQLLNHSYTT